METILTWFEFVRRQRSLPMEARSWSGRSNFRIFSALERGILYLISIAKSLVFCQSDINSAKNYSGDLRWPTFVSCSLQAGFPVKRGINNRKNLSGSTPTATFEFALKGSSVATGRAVLDSMGGDLRMGAWPS